MIVKKRRVRAWKEGDRVRWMREGTVTTKPFDLDGKGLVVIVSPDDGSGKRWIRASLIRPIPRSRAKGGGT